MRFSKIESLLCLIAFLLTSFGLIIVTSATHSFERHNQFLFKQIFGLILAIFAFIYGIRLDLNRLRLRSNLLVLIALFLCIIVLIPGIGIKVNGSSRWIGFKQIRFQVSEFAKIAFVLFLANYIGINQRVMKSIKEGFLYPCFFIGIFVLIILLEPDFGTAALFGFVGICMIFLGGTPLKFITPAIFAGIFAFLIGIFLNPVRWQRLTTFFYPEENRLTGAYQLWQSIVSFSSGGLFGIGLNNGRQSYGFLPESHTDFIFSIIGEEFGLLASVLIVFLYFSFFVLGISVARKAKNLFYFQLAIGSLLFIITQAVINMSVATGIFPTKGMSLPFISYGGSNLLFIYFLLGILINCSINGQNDVNSFQSNLMSIK